MSRNLAIKEELLDEQRSENDRLLLSLMPESVVQRYREGEETIAQKHQDVAIIFADIVGLDEMSNDLSGDELVGIVDDLFRQFDAAAEALGVERIRTFHNGYLASCGVVTPRLDSIHRSVDFALEMRPHHRSVQQSNRPPVGPSGRHQHRQRHQRAGGPIEPGLRHVGRRGESGLPDAQWRTAARNLCRPRRCTRRCATSRQFTPAGQISVGGTEQPI